MRNGHRRTQSDNYITMSSTEKLHFKLYFKQNNNHISNLLKKSNRANLSKTVCVQSLDLPAPKSYHNLLFFFGRKGLDSPTGASTQYDEDVLSPIIQKKSSRHRSLKKGSSTFSLEKKSESKMKNMKAKQDVKNQFCSSVYLRKSLTTILIKENSQTQKDTKKLKGKTEEGSSKLIKSRLRRKNIQP